MSENVGGAINDDAQESLRIASRDLFGGEPWDFPLLTCCFPPPLKIGIIYNIIIIYVHVYTLVIKSLVHNTQHNIAIKLDF